VHTIIRLARNVAEAVRKTAMENASDLLVLGWPGYTNTSGRLFGSVLDPVVDNPPTDIAVVRYRQHRPLHSILVPVAGGPNSRLAVKMAADMAQAGEGGPARVILLHVIPLRASTGDQVRAEQALSASLEGIEYQHLEKRIVEGTDVVETVLAQAEGHSLVVVGATQEPLFKNLLMGNIPEQIARRATVTVIMVKRRSSPLHSFLRQTVLEPTTAVSAQDTPHRATLFAPS
jgi:nucleotide-binding universal stress UspA family protein